MPRPHGWTIGEVKHRDKVAEVLIRKGYAADQAYAIATDQIQKYRRRRTNA